MCYVSSKASAASNQECHNLSTTHQPAASTVATPDQRRLLNTTCLKSVQSPGLQHHWGSQSPSASRLTASSPQLLRSMHCNLSVRCICRSAHDNNSALPGLNRNCLITTWLETQHSSDRTCTPDCLLRERCGYCLSRKDKPYSLCTASQVLNCMHQPSSQAHFAHTRGHQLPVASYTRSSGPSIPSERSATSPHSKIAGTQALLLLLQLCSEGLTICRARLLSRPNF